MRLLAVGIIATIIIYISCLDWKRSVKAVFFLLVIEGALRKWVLPQASELIYFLKDIVLFGAYLKYYGFSGQWKRNLSGFNLVTVALFINLGWIIFQSFNPSLGSPIIGLWGLRNYLFYSLFLGIIPNLFESEEEFKNFLRSHLLLLIPVGILGIIQYFSPSSSPINAYAPGLETNIGIAGFGLTNRVRITGPFPFVNNYVPYLVVCCGLLIPFLTIRQTGKQRNYCLIELSLLIINSFMTGSRTTVIAIGLVITGYLICKLITQFSSTIQLLKWTIPPAIILTIIAFVRFQDEIDKIFERLLYTGDLAERILLLFIEPFGYVYLKQIDGFGSGASHQATGLIRNILRLPAGEFIPTVESEMGKVMLELGFIGFVFWYGLRLVILISLFGLMLKLRRPFLRDLATTAFLIQGIWFTGQTVFHPTFSVYYWFLTSFIFLLPKLEKIENWRQYQQQFQAYEETSYFPDSPYWES